MLVEVRVPVLAESVAEATLMNWHKQPGDTVKFGDALIDIETDKVTLEIVAPEGGTLVQILKKNGEDVTGNELIAQIDTDAGAAAATPEAETEVAPVEPGSEPQAEAGEQEPAATEIVQNTVQRSLPSKTRDTGPEPEHGGPATGSTTATTPKLSPAVRNLLRERGLNAEDVPVQGDRLTKKAVLEFLKDGETAGPAPAGAEQETLAPLQQVEVTAIAAATDSTAPSPRVREDVRQIPAPMEGEGQGEGETPPRRQPAATGKPAAGDAKTSQPGERRVPMTRLRRRAAKRLLAAQRENAILTTFNEVNMKPVMDLRSRYKDSFEKTHNVKLGFMSFFTKAAVEALKKFPLLNASVDGADIIYHDYFDVGIAVSSPRGLVVPVLRDADRLSLADIEKAIGAYGQKARDAKLTIEELTGGTFTITNGGVFGSLLSTPVINPPQSAILGMHKIKERPIAEDGAVVIRPMMYLALSYDHRIIDGREAVSFLVAIKEALEEPSRLLLQI